MIFSISANNVKFKGFPGLKEGDRWCLCYMRWNEVYDAYKRGEVSKRAVPKIITSATHKKTLMGSGGWERLKEFVLE